MTYKTIKLLDMIENARKKQEIKVKIKNKDRKR